jgi:hypothetical protein
MHVVFKENLQSGIDSSNFVTARISERRLADGVIFGDEVKDHLVTDIGRLAWVP